MNKQTIIKFVVITTLSALSLCANTPPNPWITDRQIINIEELNQQKMERFAAGQLGDCILECHEGIQLPLKLHLKGEFLALDSSTATPMYFKILKTCYILCEEKEHFLFSTDMQNWKEFSEFFTGRLSLSFQADQSMVIAGVELELNQRKS